MRRPEELPSAVIVRELAWDGGAFAMWHRSALLRIIASWEGGWDHVSVSLPDRCPTWHEMDAVKRAFFRPDEVVMQLHVAEADHISVCHSCLHLWRPHYSPVPVPPKEFVA